MLRFLADENVFPNLVQKLREQGYDVKDVRESGLAGASDESIMHLALHQKRALITFDEHFADILRYLPSSLPRLNHVVVLRADTGVCPYHGADPVRVGATPCGCP